MLKNILLMILISGDLLHAQYKFIFTGGPGCGKTTTLEALLAEGYQVCPEAYGALYKEAKLDGTLDRFCSDLVYQRYLIMQRHFEQEAKLDLNRSAFLDRSIPDVIFYGNYFNVKMPIDLIQKFETHKADYAIVFFFEPVPASLYQSTDVRLESRAEALKIHQALLLNYEKHGFNIVHVPFDTVKRRVEFILNKVKNRI
jgi:predicted ATPase